MTDQINLGLIWAKNGGVTAVPEVKYESGWVAEIPTYQNFNYMVQGIDQNLLHLAEYSSYVWQGNINYKVGSKVLSSDGRLMTCVQGNIDQDPMTDSTGSYWVEGRHIGADPDVLTKADGLLVELTPRTGNLYNGQDQTVVNNLPLVVLETTSGTTKNWAVGNVGGEVTVSDLGTSGAPDNRDLSKGQGNTHRVFHEGHLPTASEVVGGVEEAPTNGKLYARKGLTAASGEWVTVTSTSVTNEPPPPTSGAGQGWYNLADGRFYVDINDGDSSQWVPASPPMVPVSAASNVTYDDTVNDLGSTVQEAISTLHDTALNANLLINGDFGIWQRGTSFSTLGLDNYTADRWIGYDATGFNTTVSQGSPEDVNGLRTTPLKFERHTLSSSGGITQRIENGEAIYNKTATLSFWAKVDSGVSSLSADVLFKDSSYNTLTAHDEYASPSFAVTTSWQFFTHTVTINESFTEASREGMMFQVYIKDLLDIATYSIAQVKLEEGPVFTGWTHVDPATELAKCQRYYETGYEHHRFQTPHTVATFTAMVDFKTSKRALPSVSLTTARGLGPETSNAITLYDTSASTYSVDTSFNVSDATSNEGFMFYKNDIYNTNDFTSFFWIADSEL